MILEVEQPQNRNKFLREKISIVLNRKGVIANPEQPVTDFLRLKTLYTFSLFFVSVAFIAGMLGEDLPEVRRAYAFIGGIAFIIFCIFLSNYIFWIRKIYSKKELDSTLKFLLDKQSISVIKESDHKTELFWSGVKCIKQGKYTMAIIPQKDDSPLFIAPVENLDEIIKFLKENEIDIKIIRPDGSSESIIGDILDV